MPDDSKRALNKFYYIIPYNTTYTHTNNMEKPWECNLFHAFTICWLVTVQYENNNINIISP